MLRKLTLVGLVLLVGRGSVAQVVTATLLSFAFFALHIATMPYIKSQWTTYFGLAQKFTFFFYLLFALR